ncbi:MAG: 1-deoxy-D-xylulose-5-phosphate reductoisomerase [Candidatus Aminicenantes bacterium]|nr:1-deoxy-D-xylulose-5-phosphate reductoisomerase [Candidatus Aminicenantes bacterium]MDH5467411.1 1-deoxy-D-xylulose-5-phosphate reductoisomerase [Candidatus Aminicenantes bacterium]MDH5706300.1 1-deoxy-D-xylulose-5-phosphate reductoisomerase [Candidatus Aminicenantes bacterium]
MDKMVNIAILGSTGSIGRSCLEVIEKLSHRFRVLGLAAGRNTGLLEKQVERFKPEIVSVERKEEAEALKEKFKGSSLRVTYSQEGAEEVAGLNENDTVVSAITGISGLRPTLAALKAGKKIALANKESMVVAGPLIQKKVREFGSQIIPVDSEHSGVFQCLAKEKLENVRKVILTASGGPFFRSSSQEMMNITPEEALNHPRWKMGRKVTIDSATLMNKGLELIEARWLFGLEPGKLGMLIHPQSIVHSLVEMNDGSVLAQLSPTDMKIPIQYALTYPERENALLPSLDLTQVRSLEFFEPDMDKFPLLKLARLALEEGASLPVALNAANEVAVASFLKKEISFVEIAEVVSEAVESHKKREISDLDDIFSVDRETRLMTQNIIKKRT